MGYDVKWNGDVIHSCDSKEEATGVMKQRKTQRTADVDAQLPDHLKDSRKEHIGVFTVEESAPRAADVDAS